MALQGNSSAWFLINRPAKNACDCFLPDKILPKFLALRQITNEAILNFLKHYEIPQISAGREGYFMDLVRPENLAKEKIGKKA